MKHDEGPGLRSQTLWQFFKADTTLHMLSHPRDLAPMDLVGPTK